MKIAWSRLERLYRIRLFVGDLSGVWTTTTTAAVATPVKGNNIQSVMIKCSSPCTLANSLYRIDAIWTGATLSRVSCDEAIGDPCGMQSFALEPKRTTRSRNWNNDRLIVNTTRLWLGHAPHWNTYTHARACVFAYPSLISRHCLITGSGVFIFSSPSVSPWDRQWQV